jgi:hypothetical protein
MSQIPNNKSIHRKLLKDYKQQQKCYLLTSRFSNVTIGENAEYRKKNPKLGCIYCSPEPVSMSIPIESIMFILEMNNDTNKIVGVGMVRNHSICGKYHVYNEGNYNRYVYTGKMRVSREEMTEEEDQIMKVFDILCFTGNRHMKRGQGLKSFPTDMLFRCRQKLDLVNFVSNMFKKRLLEKNTIADEKI